MRLGKKHYLSLEKDLDEGVLNNLHERHVRHSTLMKNVLTL